MLSSGIHGIKMLYLVGMDWDDVRYFLAVSREGSVRAAGSILAVSHSTVARRVEALEEKLKVRLFDRTPEGYALTSAGRQMVEGAERVEVEMAALERRLLGQDESFHGLVRVTCANEYLSDMIVRDLAAYCATYPGIDLAVTSSFRSFDLSKREADIAVRMTRIGKDPPWAPSRSQACSRLLCKLCRRRTRYATGPGNHGKGISMARMGRAQSRRTLGEQDELPTFTGVGLIWRGVTSGVGHARWSGYRDVALFCCRPGPRTAQTGARRPRAGL